MAGVVTNGPQQCMKITLRESAFCILISHVGCFNLPLSISTQAAASAQDPDRHLLLSPRWFGFLLHQRPVSPRGHCERRPGCLNYSGRCRGETAALRGVYWVGGSFTKWAVFFFLSPTFRVNVKCGLIHWPLNSFNSA